MSALRSPAVKAVPALLFALAAALPAGAIAAPAPEAGPSAPVPAVSGAVARVPGATAPAVPPAPDPAAPARADEGAAPAPSPELAALPEAAPKGFSARVEPDRVELGRPFRLTLEVRHDPAERYALAGEPALGGLTARGAPAVERTEADGTATTRIVLELAAFDALGDRALPEQLLVGEGPAGKARLAIPGPPLHVVAVSEGEELANPPPEPLVLVAWDRVAIAAGAALGLALAVLAFLRLRKRRPVAAAGPAEVDRRTALERTLAAIDALEAESGITARERYFRLSAAVRGFLSEVSDLPAVDLTTRELGDALARRPIPGLALPAFRAWLERGDLVRFAREEPAATAVAVDFEEARTVVREVDAARRAEEERRRAALAAAGTTTADGTAPGDGSTPGDTAASGARPGEIPAEGTSSSGSTPKAGEGGR